jgi:uncharacterized membrane protein YhaH (DUF805 family)
MGAMDFRAEIEAAVRTGFENYVNFEGRAALRPFWMWVIFEVGVQVLAYILDAIVGTFILGSLVGLALVLPSLAFGSRRLHDTGKSGWYQAAAIIPLIGWIYVIYLFAQPGEMQTNAWGPVPA